MSSPESTSDTTGVTFTSDGNMEIHLISLSQAKLALEELEIKKNEYWDAKKKIVQRQEQIRVVYTEDDHNYASKQETGGSFGYFLAINAVDTMRRNSARRKREKQLAVLDEQEETLDANIEKVDRAIRQVTSYIHLNSD